MPLRVQVQVQVQVQVLSKSRHRRDTETHRQFNAMKSSNQRYAAIAIATLAAGLLAACGTPVKPLESTGTSTFTSAPKGAATSSSKLANTTTEADWLEVKLPGKRATDYTWEQFDGRRVLAAHSQSSASMMRCKLLVSPTLLGTLNFSWQVSELMDGADVSVAETEDAPARVMLAFGGDVSKLPMRTRMLFELAHAVGGEEPPYATLMYVWDRVAPVGSVIVNPRTDRIRKIVVDSGPHGLKRWRDHKRDMAADFRLAFGEEPGPLVAIAVMTDSDNTKSNSRAWYGPLSLE